MNRAFREVTAAYQHGTGPLTHAQVVTRMYRQALKLCMDWTVTRSLFLREAAAIRAEFDAHKELHPDSGETKRLIREAKERMAKITHPDPYVAVYMPGGSKFMRNAAPPLKVVFPEGVPVEADVAPLNLEGVQVPVSAEKDGYESIVVDIYKKKAE